MMISRWWASRRSRPQHTFDLDALWFTALTGSERVIALVQTVLIARSLGSTEYGVYGLLFSTIGNVAAVVALQMGLTATVFVAKYRETDNAKAAGVISMVDRFGWIVAGVFVAATIPFSHQLAEALLGSSDYSAAVTLGIVLVATTLLSGMQDGVAQGFEMFAFLAKLKMAVAMLVVVGIYELIGRFGLNGVVSAIIAGLVVKSLILRWAIRKRRSEAGIPAVGGGVSFRTLVSNFALPSMIISLASGYITWLGLFILSNQSGGFDGVAVVNTGIQWRSPLLLLATAVATVAVPAFSRFAQSGDALNSGKLRFRLLMIGLVTSVAGSLVAVLLAGPILKVYELEFSASRETFLLVIVSAIPTVITQMYFQQWVGAARMWRILILHVPYLLIGWVSFVVLVPRYHAFGYAVANLLGAVVLMATVLIGNYSDGRLKGGDVPGRA